MPRGDAVQQAPSVADQVAKFTSFSTTDGEVSDGGQTAEETAAHAAREEQDTAAAKAADKNAARRQPAAAEKAPAEEGEATEETPAAEGETTEETPAAAAPAVKSKETAQQRINKAIAKQRSAERALESERSRNDDLARRLDRIEKGGLTAPKDATTSADTTVAPDPKDFEFGELDARYIKAATRFEVRQELAAHKANQEKQTLTAAQQRRQAEMETKHDALIVAGEAAYDDFDVLVVQNSKLPDSDPDYWACSEVISDLAHDSKFGKDVLYHLASNPKEAKTVFGKTPMEQAAYFGRLEAKFSSASGASAAGKPAARVTQATRPLNGVRASGSKTSDGANTSDFKAFESQWKQSQRQ